MKLVLEHQPHRFSRPYVVYLEHEDNPSLVPYMSFETESDARRFCELRVQSRQIAEYQL